VYRETVGSVFAATIWNRLAQRPLSTWPWLLMVSGRILGEGGFRAYTRPMLSRDTLLHTLIRPFAQAVYMNRNYRFWFFQITGWGGYSLATFLSITLAEGNLSWLHIGHICLSAALGILTSWPLRTLYHRTFDLALSLRLLIATFALLVLSGVWTVLRILVFAWLVGEEAIWHEFNYWYFGSLFVFLSWTVLYYGINYYELLTLEHQKLLEESALKREEQMRRLQAETSARDAQLQMLRYQLNPHFLFNTLNAINALVNLRENERAQEMLKLLSDFLRHSLEQDGIENVCLAQELESLMLYLNIEKVRFEDRLALEIDVDPAARQALVPSLILQPIVENAMKYAIAVNEEGGTVRISGHVVGDQLRLEVSDSGPGLNNIESEHGRGLGLRNTLERLQTLYQQSFSFDTVDVHPSGLSVQIHIPYQTSQPSMKASGVTL
jgi:two-component system LytT family sensor kinase